MRNHVLSLVFTLAILTVIACNILSMPSTPTPMVIVGTATSPLTTRVTPTTSAIKPMAGDWEGWIDSPTSEGSERHFWIQFEVNQDAMLAKDDVKDVWVAYIEGPILPGAIYQNSRAETTEIVGNQFNSVAQAIKPTGGFPPTFYKVRLELEGIFVSPTKLEGTFKSSEDNGWQNEGKWTAQIKQSTQVHPTNAISTLVPTYVEYSGTTWVIKEIYLEQQCASPVHPFVGSTPNDNCLTILIDLESNTSSLITKEPQSTPFGYVLQVEDDSAKRYSPFEEVYMYDKSGEWLGHQYYFSVSKDAEQFFLVVPGSEKISLNYSIP